MNDEQLFKFASITAILGIVGMMFFAGKITPQEIKVKDMNKGMLEQEVSIEGFVEKIDKSSKSNTYFLSLVDETGKTKVIIFEGIAENFENENLSIQSFEKRQVKVIGRVSEYKGNMELILKDAKSIKIID